MAPGQQGSRKDKKAKKEKEKEQQQKGKDVAAARKAEKKKRIESKEQEVAVRLGDTIYEHSAANLVSSDIYPGLKPA